MLLIPIAYALPECQRVTNVADIPCNIISSHNNSGNCYMNSSIYNETPSLVGNLTWGNYTPNCAAVFNISDIGTYHYEGIDEGVITVEGDAEIIAAIIVLIPLILSIVCIIGAFSLGEKHAVLAIYLFLLSFVSFFTSFYFGGIMVVRFMDFPELQDAIGSSTYWYSILFGGIVLYFLLYMFYMFVKSAAKAKQERMEY